MWLLAFICVSLVPIDTQAKPPRDPEEMLCKYDGDCGEGHCWVGLCESGICVGYNTCV